MKVDTKVCFHFFVLKYVKGGFIMAGKRNHPNRYWSKEDKLKLVNLVIINNQSINSVAKENKIDKSQLRRWIEKYYEFGEKGLINKRKPGNPLMKYSSRKELNELEKLEYENMKLKIENERLKKGYMMKGDGTVVVYKK